MENQQAERTIYFKDLVFSILYKWRAILAAMIIGAVLLGGLEWMGTTGEVTLHSVSITPENQIKIDHYQRTLERTELLIEGHEVYLDESILMSLDSYAAYSANICVSISSDSSTDETVAFLYAYRTGLLDAVAMEETAKKYDTQTIYLMELITATVTDTGVLDITVRGRTPEEVQSLVAFLTEVLEAQQETVRQLIAPHQLKMNILATGPMVDKALYDLQNIAHQRLTTLKNTVTSTTTELNKLLPTQLQAGQPQPLLFAIVGAFLGAFLVATFACVQHIGSGKVYSARTLKDRTGIRILGRVGIKKYKPIDRWLRKLEGRAPDAQVDGIVADIVNRCAQHQHLLVFGASNDQLIHTITDALTVSGIQCTVCAEAANSAQVIKSLPKCDAAVLVETCGESAYDDVIWAVETVNEYDKTLLGCVLING